MTKDVAKKQNVLELMANRYNLGSQTFMTTLKSTLIKPDREGKMPSDEQIVAFLLVANKYELNPFTKEIYAFPDKAGGIVPVVGYDGFITLARRADPSYKIDEKVSDDLVTPEGGKECFKWCEITVTRCDGSHVTVREYLDEVYRPPFKTAKGFVVSGPWQTHTKRMLRTKALIQAFRLTYGISGVFDEDEAARIVEAKTIDGETAEVVMPKMIEKQPAPVQSVDQEQAPVDQPAGSEQQPPPPQDQTGERVISEKQIGRLLAIAKANGHSVEDVNTKLLYDWNINSKSDIPVRLYDEIVNKFSIQKGA